VPPELASAREVEPGDWPSAQDIATNIVAQTQQSGRNDVFDALVAWVLSPAHKDHGCLIGVLSTIEKWTELMPQLVTRDLLWTMSSHPEFSVRSSSAAICMDWAQFAPNLVPVDVLFRLAVHDEDWYVQAPATAALKSLAHGQPSVLQWFYQRLGHPNAEARSHAAQAIADIADREPEILDGDELERAATRLTEMGDRDALKQLQRVVPTVKSVKRENSRYRYSL
jgi:hypothetical protein